MKSTAVYLLLALLALGAGWYVGQSGTPEEAVGTQPAPDFRLLDLNGQVHTTADYRGRVMLVNFWATWCAPCLTEMPLLNAAHQRYQAQGLTVLGPALDDSAAVNAYVNAHGIDYPILLGEEPLFDLMDAFGDTLGGLPFTVIVDREGRIAERHWGGLDAAGLDRLIQRHLTSN